MADIQWVVSLASIMHGICQSGTNSHPWSSVFAGLHARCTTSANYRQTRLVEKHWVPCLQPYRPPTNGSIDKSIDATNTCRLWSRDHYDGSSRVTTNSASLLFAKRLLSNRGINLSPGTQFWPRMKFCAGVLVLCENPLPNLLPNLPSHLELAHFTVEEFLMKLNDDQVSLANST